MISSIPASKNGPIEQEVGQKDKEQKEYFMCANPDCENASDTQYYLADVTVCKYYEAEFTKEATVCEECANAVAMRNEVGLHFCLSHGLCDASLNEYYHGTFHTNI